MVESESTYQARASANHSPVATSTRLRTWWWLGGTGLISWWLYVALVWLSRGFTYATPGPDRPLIPALAVLAVLFALYLVQVVLVIRGRAGNAAVPVIVVFAIAFRLLLLFSEPIQEVDAYRYLWDGKVVVAGVNPFRFSPEQVLTANYSADQHSDFSRLIDLRDRSAANAEILARVHFGELTTVYPPVSQAVFALAAFVTPESANTPTHLLVMKSLIVVFDLATLWVLILLLRFVGRPAELSVVYAWCPLVLKEFANSGHLDSIAVFLTATAILFALRAFYPGESTSNLDASFRPQFSSRTWMFLAAIVLSLGVGAKIYPIILAPLLFLSAWRRFGRTEAVLAGVLSLTLALLLITPMLLRDRTDQTQQAHSATGARRVETIAPQPDPSLPPKRPGPRINPDSTGLAAFAGQWQMNDFLFLLLFENFKPNVVPVDQDITLNELALPALESAPTPTAARAVLNPRVPTAWFVFTSQQWRTRFVNVAARYTPLQPEQVPFQAARVLTTVVFVLLALSLAIGGMKSDAPDDWLRAVFLTVAWFWLLLPTQNPWYWIWALPFVPFARSRAWLAMSGLILLYYLRFWFAFHADLTPVPGIPYAGVDFFDFIVSWIEYGPWFIWLMWTSRWSGGGSGNAPVPLTSRTGKSPRYGNP